MNAPLPADEDEDARIAAWAAQEAAAAPPLSDEVRAKVRRALLGSAADRAPDDPTGQRQRAVRAAEAAAVRAARERTGESAA